jgi:hypothetical protein
MMVLDKTRPTEFQNQKGSPSPTERYALYISSFTSSTINNYGNIDSNWFDNCNSIDYSEEKFNSIRLSMNHYAIRNINDYYKKVNQLDKVSGKKTFINGLLQMLELDDSLLITDNTMTKYSHID